MAPKLLLAVVLLSVVAMGAFASSSRLVSLDDENLVLERVCNESGSLGDCVNPAQELLVDSEAAHRSLVWINGHKYISYAAMRKNNIPCSRRGTSYYNCNRSQSVNPYRRGCSAITRCARFWQSSGTMD